MTRKLRTLLLSATALGALVTAAAAAPPTPSPSTDAMAGMHAPAGMTGTHPGTSQMHTGGGDMTAMHATMMADSAVHESMLDDPSMQAHRAEYGIDADRMRRWHDEAGSVDEMHEALAQQGIDVDAMQADCPMHTGDSMATMPRHGGHDSSGHHGTPGGDRP